MKKKPIIHEFDPVIYQCRIWVSMNPSFEDVSERFYAVTSDTERMDIKKDEYDDNYFSIARTHPVSSKQDGWIGLLVCVFRPRQCDVGLMAHEAVHCTDFICNQFGVTNGDFINGEAYAYLVQWIANCIDKVRRGKV